MRNVPLLLVPFLLYNAFAFLIFTDYAAGFSGATIFTVPMASGTEFALTVSAAIIVMALVLLGFEVVKATRVGSNNVVDQVFATALFVVFLLEFLFVRQAATSTFLILMAIALVDLVCGFAVSLKAAHRDVTVGG